MSNEGFWVLDPDTNEPRFLYLSELEGETIQQLLRPVGGFCYSASSFMHLPLPQVPYYLQDWLPKMGKAMIYAPAKSGKSYLSLQVSRCIGAGLPFLGIPTTQGTVLYVQFELGQEVLQARLASTGQEYPNVFVGTSFSMKLDQRAGQEVLKKALEAIEPNVLIIDPLFKCIAGDENEGVDMRNIADFLDEMIEAFRCSVLLIHHPGKDISRGSRGSSILEDWVDSSIEMRKLSKNGEPLRVKLTPKLLRHAELPPDPIEATMVNFEFQQTIHEETITVKGTIRDIMKDNPTMVFAPRDFFEENVGSNASVHDGLKELVREGAIERLGQGKYAWKEESDTGL